MMGFDRTDDYQPLTYIKGHALYVTTVLVISHVVTLVLGCIARGFDLKFGGESFVQFFGFDADAATRGWQVWRFFTYAFVHPLDQSVSVIFFAIQMYFLYQFGREVERYFGRRIFILIYAFLLLVPPALLAAVHPFMATVALVDSGLVHFGVFLAFVTVYPSVEFFLGIPAKWIAFAYLALDTLYLLSTRQGSMLMVLWATAGVAYFGCRQAGAQGGFSLLRDFRDRFPAKAAPAGVRPRAKPRRNGVEAGASDWQDSVDPLLEKISKHGLASLTHSERATLERARVSLLRKERGG